MATSPDKPEGPVHSLYYCAYENRPEIKPLCNYCSLRIQNFCTLKAVSWDLLPSDRPRRSFVLSLENIRPVNDDDYDDNNKINQEPK